MRLSVLALLIAVALTGCAQGARTVASGATPARSDPAPPTTPSNASATPVPNPFEAARDTSAAAYAVRFDPARDPAADVRAASEVARREGKRILLDVGGEWCIWCHRMDAFFEANPDLKALRDDAFVLVKVNVSEENMNAAFLSAYPEIPGYPHLFVLNADGTFLHSQGTSELEEGPSYNAEAVRAFLTAWAPPAGG
ncbi:MAG TPA: thioredoxin family protein [Rubricoccaceae bacterium]|nr:thioredoxin family protein [Rubricoccaceae bacterium]